VKQTLHCSPELNLHPYLRLLRYGPQIESCISQRSALYIPISAFAGLVFFSQGCESLMMLASETRVVVTKKENVVSSMGGGFRCLACSAKLALHDSWTALY
jgi:hypothetical protein